ncbi:16S rRNA (guanine(527)-N(7))-methyltransferase RsmG [Deinococcus sp.]|uniref:16S rRNA (guanine(527)-N(7))-methyltransferase RsmG n=1 Tax=Deinococcus sp. TaxID=47478 RepID=UPI003C7DB100
MTPEAGALLVEGATALDLDVSSHLDSFASLLKLLQEGNARLNLTALRTENDIVIKHFVDSLSCLRGGFLDGNLRVLDLGTGAGFPSLPLAILRPELYIVPLDSTRKKIDYVRATAQTLALGNVHPLVGRAETLGHHPAHRETYDRVVVRAVAALPVLAELALPLLRPGGLLVAQKGPISSAELEAGRRAAALLGGVLGEIQTFELPVLHDPRTLICIRKTGPTPSKYPRREGVPVKHPLF